MGTEKRKAAVLHNQFFVLQLLAVIRRFRKEHNKTSATIECGCGICSAALKLIRKFDAESKFSKKKQKQ